MPNSEIESRPDEYKVARILLSEKELGDRVNQLGAELAERYRGKQPILVTLLKGGFIFLADLSRAMKIPHEIEFMIVRSYEKDSSSGTVQIIQDLKQNIEGRHVVLVEDIVDTGLTLSYIREHLSIRNPASLTVCSLLDKTEARKIQVPIEMVGFSIPNEFVVGYGLDYDQLYRNLPYLAIIDPEQA